MASRRAQILHQQLRKVFGQLLPAARLSLPPLPRHLATEIAPSPQLLQARLQRPPLKTNQPLPVTLAPKRTRNSLQVAIMQLQPLMQQQLTAVCTLMQKVVVKANRPRRPPQCVLLRPLHLPQQPAL